MKAEFDFDGDSLRIYIKVEDECEIALAKVLEKYNRSHVCLDYGSDGFYSSYRREEPKGIRITMKESPKCYANGQACTRNCDFNDGGTGCKMLQAASSHAASNEDQPK